MGENTTDYVPQDDEADRHVTHIEQDHRGWYFWCEADDCYGDRRGRRHHTSAEAHAAASFHEASPG